MDHEEIRKQIGDIISGYAFAKLKDLPISVDAIMALFATTQAEILAKLYHKRYLLVLDKNTSKFVVDANEIKLLALSLSSRQPIKDNLHESLLTVSKFLNGQDGSTNGDAVGGMK